MNRIFGRVVSAARGAAENTTVTNSSATPHRTKWDDSRRTRIRAPLMSCLTEGETDAPTLRAGQQARNQFDRDNCMPLECTSLPPDQRVMRTAGTQEGRQGDCD